MTSSRGLRFEETRFWVTHRRREYGPFDYDWSRDFCGVELLYQGRKFGEYCNPAELFADLKPFRLPMRVVEVTSVVVGAVLLGVLNGLSESEKHALVVEKLHEHELGEFAEVIERRAS